MLTRSCCRKQIPAAVHISLSGSALHMSVPEHGELVHRVVLQIFKHFSAVGLLKHCLAVSADFHISRMTGRAADAAARTHHPFDEILRQSSQLQQLDCLFVVTIQYLLSYYLYP